MAKNYDLLKQLIEGTITRADYEKKVEARRVAEQASAADTRLFSAAQQQEAIKAKEEAKKKIISLLPKEDQAAIAESAKAKEIDAIVETLVSGPSVQVSAETGFPEEEPQETAEPQEEEITYTIYDINGKEDFFRGTREQFAKFMTGNPKYYPTKDAANKALIEMQKEKSEGIASATTTTTTTTTDEGPLYWGRYDSGSWATSTEAGKPEGFTWAWELPEFAGTSQSDFTSDKTLDEILGQVTDGSSTGGPTGGPTGGTTTVTGNFDGRMGSQIWQDETGQKYLTFGIPGTNMFVRYKASDDDLATFFTTGMPDVRTVTENDEDWNNSLWLGNYVEIDDEIKLGLKNPFDAIVDNFVKLKKVQPWMENDELYSLYLEGIIEDRDIADYEWQGTQWWQEHTKEQRDWLLLSQGKGIDALPADAKALYDNNIIKARQLLNQYGVTNAADVTNPEGESLVEFFALQLTTGAWTELNWANQAKGLGDNLAGIEQDVALTSWLEGLDEDITPETTQAGYAQAKALALKWLGPSFANFEESNLEEYAGMIRNAESTETGIAAVENKLKNIRKALFSTDLYEENLTYEDIASPWRNYSFQFLGQRMDETASEWIDVLKANDQEKINSILLEYGLNNDIQTMFDRVTDGIVKGITPQAVVRGLPT